jgi:hypothetical protein
MLDSYRALHLVKRAFTMSKTTVSHRIIWLIALSLSLAAVFQTQISTGFTVLTGDRLDGLIETSILEHWYNVSGLFSSRYEKR